MFDGRVRLNLPNVTPINEDLTTYTLYPGQVSTLPTITREIGSYFIPLIDKTATSTGPYVDENNTVSITIGNSLTLQVEAYNQVDVQNGIVVSGSGAQNLTYTWRKDGAVLVPNRRITIARGRVDINSLSVSDSGAYTVEVTNDVGTVLSDTLTLEVIDTTTIPQFNNNLVQNFDGSQNLNFWTETSTQGNQLFVSKLINNASKAALTGDPVKDANVLGYAYPNHFNPTDINKPLQPITDESFGELPKPTTTVLFDNGTFFTRRPFVSYLNNGSSRVQFYQDIDLTDIERYIEGSVTGVKSVQMNFQCYIGNSISYFIPKKNVQQTPGRIKTDAYCFETALPKPRLSSSNEQYVEPVSEDFTVVYIEEYDGDDLLKVHGPINDPYRTRFQIQKSNGVVTDINFRDSQKSDPNIMAHNLFSFYVSSSLQPSNLGQFIALRELEVDMLNSKTNKLRVRVEFLHDGLQQVQSDSPADAVQNYNTNGIYIIPTWLYDKTAQPKSMLSSYTFGKSNIPQNPTTNQILPLYGQPRNFITGFNIFLTPVPADKTRDRNVTNLITAISNVIDNKDVTMSSQTYEDLVAGKQTTQTTKVTNVANYNK